MSRQETFTHVEYKDFAKPDEVRTFDKGKIELLNIAGGTVGRMTLEPGWQWSKHVKPIAKTDMCLVAHFQCILSGKIRIRMEDGREFDLGPGSVSVLPEGHDAWVVGDEPAVGVDWAGAANYAK